MRIPVYWINLQRSADRREHLLKNFHEKGIIHRRIEAVSHEKSHIGCCLSHITAIYTAWSNGNEYALICEDDVDFFLGVEVFQRIEQILTTLPTSVKDDWEVLQLQYIEPTFLKMLLPYVQEQNRVIKGYFMGAAAYLINRKGMEKFLSLMVQEDITEKGVVIHIKASLDHPLAKSEELIYRYISSYISVFPVLNCYPSMSTIGDTDEYMDIQNTNQALLSDVLTQLTLLNYAIPPSESCYALEYHLHWFGGDEDRARRCLTDIFS